MEKDFLDKAAFKQLFMNEKEIGHVAESVLQKKENYRLFLSGVIEGEDNCQEIRLKNQ